MPPRPIRFVRSRRDMRCRQQGLHRGSIARSRTNCESWAQLGHKTERKLVGFWRVAGFVVEIGENDGAQVGRASRQRLLMALSNVTTSRALTRIGRSRPKRR